MRWTVVTTPIGPLGVAADATAVRAVSFDGAQGPLGTHPFTERVADELGRYFAGELTGFSVPLAITAGTRFERAVWAAIAAIPYGYTRTYGEIASGLGDPGAARAVGIACNRNPLPVLIACHRVIGAGGRLVGFGGGLDRKRHLLGLEARVRVEQEFLL